MKISDASQTQPAAPTRRKSAAAPAEQLQSPAPVDQVWFAGIPENELTPRVREALQSLFDEVQKLREELANARTKIGDLENLADRDPLLDILNRRAFVRELNRALGMMERYATKASLIFVDVNGLKKVNDVMGHAAGDAALEHVAHKISSNVRQTDVVGRLGGDEFGVILLEADQETAQKKGAVLSELVSAEPVSWRGKPFTARISFGAIEIKKGATVDQALETADFEMYRTKRAAK
ncbi:MAG: GGDEF domain-containing protein [Parvularculaceae bacterium]